MSIFCPIYVLNMSQDCPTFVPVNICSKKSTELTFRSLSHPTTIFLEDSIEFPVPIQNDLPCTLLWCAPYLSVTHSRVGVRQQTEVGGAGKEGTVLPPPRHPLAHDERSSNLPQVRRYSHLPSLYVAADESQSTIK